MIASLLPAAVSVAEEFDDLADALLYPEEEEVVARAVDRRRAEFATARACARRALVQLGLPAGAVRRGPNREPLWPPGVVGSITHCDGYRAAVVARAADLAALGVDAEPHEPLPDGVLDAISLEEERRGLRALSREEPAVCWDRLLFSAKESVYKAWYPLAARWLGFEHAVVTIDASDASFQARLLVPGPALGDRPLTALRGRWLIRGGLVLTAVALPPPAAGAGPGEASGEASGLRS